MTTTTYFTFPDGGVRYTCAGCGACCKGHGIGLDVTGGQLVQLVARRPEIAAFLRRRGDTITAFNPRDRCWFLAGDGLCRIETEDGRAAKPASCRLFPFNRVFRLGDATIVDFNSVICPIELAPAGTGITHAEIAAEIATIADPAVVGTKLPAQHPAAEGVAFVAAERGIATALFAAAASLDARTTAAASLEPGLDARTTAAAEQGWAAQADPAAFATEQATLTAAFATCGGAAFSLPTVDTLRHALVVTPSLRFNELYGPRQYAPRAAMPPVLARMWLAWLGFAAAGERLAARSLGIQELTTLWSEQAPLLHALARWTEIPSLKPGPIELPGSDPGGHVRGLAQRCIDNRKAKLPLSALVEVMPADSVLRVTVLKQAENVVRAAFAR